MRRWLTPLVLSCVLLAGMSPLRAAGTDNTRPATRKARKFKAKKAKKHPKAKWGHGNKTTRTVQ